jgi:sodium transport system permease protein
VNFTDVSVVLRKELRETLRDRRTLAVMVLFPLVVYPLVSLLMAEVVAGKQAADEARPSRVTIVARGSDAAAVAAVRAGLRGRQSGVEIVPTSSAGTIADVTTGRVDALVETHSPDRGGAPQPIHIFFDETRETSERAHARIETALGGVLPPGCTRSFAVAATSIAPKSKVGGYVLSKILPLIVVLMTMLGAFYPAIDITAGERERGTLETLLSSPVRRIDLMTGKVLAVAVLATLTGILNIVSMSVTVAEGARLAAGTSTLTIPWTRAAATVLTVIPAAFLFASVMVAIGALARGFKEAQTLLTPVYLLCLTPALLATIADFPLTGIVLVVPGTNLTLLARDLMLAHATIPQALVVLGSTLVYGALALWFAVRLYDSERLLAASDANLIGLSAWIRHLAGRPPATAPGAGVSPPPSGATAEHALALFGIAFVLSFFLFPWLQRWRLIPGLLMSQWGGFLGLLWIYSSLTRRSLVDVVGIRRPHRWGWAFGGATLLGLSGWIVLGMLVDRFIPPPRQLIEEMRRLIRPPGGDRPLAVSLVALALTPAICEEALFRGPILAGLRKRFSAPAACLVTGVLFGVLHGDVWRFIPTSLLGALLSWVTLSSGSILPAMLIHFVNNGALIVLGYYGLDEATENLSARAELAILAGAAIMFLGGLGAIRRARAGGRGHGPGSS